MYKQDMQLGGIHAHQTWPTTIYERITPHSCYELGLFKLLNKPKKMKFLQYVYV